MPPQMLAPESDDGVVRRRVSLQEMWCQVVHPPERKQIKERLSGVDKMKKLWIFWWISLFVSAVLVMTGAALVGGWEAVGTALVVLGVIGVGGCAVYAVQRL